MPEEPHNPLASLLILWDIQTGLTKLVISDDINVLEAHGLLFQAMREVESRIEDMPLTWESEDEGEGVEDD